MVESAIESSRARILGSIGDLRDVVFIRAYGNLGDELIYAGTRNLLAGVPYREASILRLEGVSGHTALVSGSGGWCAPYHDMPGFLASIEGAFESVIILPSSFDISVECVRSTLATTRAKVFARDEESYRQIRNLCDADIAHDCAFFFDYAPYRCSGRGVLNAFRSDAEAVGAPLPRGNIDVSVACSSLDEWLWTIARSQVVRTDRAHVMIAAALLGKRVEYRTSKYHKVPAIAAYALRGFPVTAILDVDPDTQTSSASVFQSPFVPLVDVPRSVAEGTRAALRSRAEEDLRLLPEDFAQRHQEIAITIVMLSHGRLDVTLTALSAVRANVRVPYKLLVVDNASEPEMRVELRRAVGQDENTELILLETNLGCAAGRAYALSHVTTEYVMFIDNDIELLPGAVEHLLHVLESKPDVWAAAACVVLPSGRLHLCGGDYFVQQDVLHYTLLGSGRMWDDWSVGKSGECRWVNGGSTLYRRRVFEECPLSTKMHGYYEDLEWCYRARKSDAPKFYRCIESLTLHHHEPKALWYNASREEAREQAMGYISLIAQFWRDHGVVLRNVFDFVPELGEPAGRGVAAAKLLLELVLARGTAWVLDQWNNHGLEPLFAVEKVDVKGGLQGLLHALGGQQRAIETLISRLAATSEAAESPDAAAGLQVPASEEDKRESSVTRGDRDATGDGQAGPHNNSATRTTEQIVERIECTDREIKSLSEWVGQVKREVELLHSTRLLIIPSGSLRERVVRMFLRGLQVWRTRGFGALMQAAWARLVGAQHLRASATGSLGNQIPLGVPRSMDVIVFPIIEWAHRFQRPQQIAAQYALNGHRVFYLSFEPCDSSNTFTWEAVGEGIFELHVPGLEGVDRFVERMPAAALEKAAIGLEAFAREARIGEAVCVVQLPFWGPLALALRAKYGWRVVYECMDELDGLAILRSELLQDETDLARRADMVITTSSRLLEKHAENNARCFLVPNACEYQHFHTRSRRRELRRSHHPIIGYVGAIMGWFDDEVIRVIAEDRPEWSIVLVGRVDSPAARDLGRLPNVQLLGEQPYERIPAFVQAFDVCLIPFKLSTITLSTNPVKFYEYLCAGKPVVSSRLPELSQHSELFYPATGGLEFVSQIEKALREDDAEHRKRRIAWASEQTWEARYDAINRAIYELYPIVSIIIVSYNGLADTERCVHSILEKTIYPNYEVIIVDNGSEARTVKGLRRLAAADSRVRVIANVANEGFAKGVNIGFESARRESAFVVILNNDTVVTSGWLCGLLRWLRDPAVGVVGPVTCPSGAANEAAVGVTYSDLDEMEAAAWQYTSEHAGQSLEVEMLALFCAALRRDVYEKIGPLDERFGIGMFEDDDYAVRVRRAGYKLLCVDDVFVHHKGRASFSLLDTRVYEGTFAENRRRFETKWNAVWRAPHGR